jgi:integrase
MEREVRALDQGAEATRAMRVASADDHSLLFSDAYAKYPGEKKHFGPLLTLFWEMRLDAITDKAMTDGAGQVCPTSSVETEIRHYWQLLRALYRWAAEQGHCRRRRIMVPKAAKTWSPRVLTAVEEARLLAEIPGHIRLPVLLQLRAGLRPGAEIRELEWSDLHPERREVHIRARRIRKEVRLSRNVPLSGDLLAEAERQRQSSGRVCRRPDGERYQGRGFRSALRAACVRANIEPISEQTLRDTWVIRLLEAGCTLSDLARLGGWSDERTPARYRAFWRSQDQGGSNV